MGQFFGIEKIAQPTYSGGYIYLPASDMIKIEEQGYRTTSAWSNTQLIDL